MAYARRGHRFHAVGRCLSATLDRQSDARGALVQYKLATVAGRVDVTATYNKFIRSLRVDDTLNLRPPEIIAIAYLDGELRPADLVRCITSNDARLRVTTLETFSVRLFGYNDVVMDV